MFLFDQWEELEADPRMDAKTLRAARELADNMCAIIFERMGLTTITDELNLQVTGRGLRYVFPLRVGSCHKITTLGRNECALPVPERSAGDAAYQERQKALRADEAGQ